MNRDNYTIEIHSSEVDYPLPVEVLATDEDLYWHIVHSMYFSIEENSFNGLPTVMIVPVGPVFQYRRFVDLYRMRPIDLSGLRLFFMDEYMKDARTLVDRSDSLSFRGFIDREFLEPLQALGALTPEQLVFPDPERTTAYDEALAGLGNAHTCIAGVGITGHVAFNDPPEPGEHVSAAAFRSLPTRVVTLSRETVVINSNTAMRGAYDQIPRQAVTVGMRQILDSQRIRVYLNRPWQSAVVRRMLFDDPTPQFPVTLLRGHNDVRICMTHQVAEKPDFMLR